MNPAVIGGKYQVLGPIGKGGMGMVYSAVHAGTGRQVAVKIMHIQKAQEGEGLLIARFEREARLAGSIETQHICRVYDTGVDETLGMPFMVMERLAGEDVHRLIRRMGPFPVDLALRVAAQACVGLARAHETGVIHRDIKPSNIFLSQGEFGNIIVKLLDFGIAKVNGEDFVDADSRELTRTGVMLGSPHFMSPEQAMGLKTIDSRSDIWSLGVVLFKMLTGRAPHDDRDTLGQVIVAVCTEKPREVQEFAPWVPPDVAEIVHRALQMDPAQRFQTATEMHDALARLLPNADIQPDMVHALTDDDRAPAARRMRETPTPSIGTNSGTEVSLAQVIRLRRLIGERLLIMTGALAIVALGGWAALQAFDRPHRAAPAPANATATTATSPATAAAQTSSTDPLSLERTVTLTVSPATVSAEVDGAAAHVAGGQVTLVGDLGSIHKVRIFVGKQETTSDVVITEQGARPPQLTLAAVVPVMLPGGAHLPPGKTTGPATAPPATTAPTVKPPSTGGFDTKFQ